MAFLADEETRCGAQQATLIGVGAVIGGVEATERRGADAIDAGGEALVGALDRGVGAAGDAVGTIGQRRRGGRQLVHARPR